MKDHLEFVREWYGKAEIGRDLPIWIAGSKGLVSIVSQISMKAVRVAFSPKHAAFGSVYRDAENIFRISIGSMFLNEAMIAEFASELDEKRLLVLGCSNGTVIHESAHILVGSLQAYEKVSLRADSRLADCFNIVEDIFIEAVIRKDFPTLSRFVEMKNEFLFKRALAETLEKPELATVSNVAALAKFLIGDDFDQLVRKVIIHKDVQDRLISIVKRSRDASLAIEHRISLASELRKLMSASGDTGSSEETSRDVLAMGMPAILPGESLRIDADAMASSLDGSELIDPEFISLPASVTSLSKMDSVEFVDGLPILSRQASNEYGDKLPFTEGVSGLHKHLRCITTPKTTPGAPKRRGKLVPTRISRIATDGKVFSDRYETQVLSTPEVRILVDGSGSMGKEFFSQCLSAAITIKRDLDSAGITCSVLAHTADRRLSGLGKEVNIVEVAPPHRINHTLLRTRAAWAADPKESLMLYENRDGNAIKHAAKGFTSGNDKVLIVLSDGIPAASGYHGALAIEHTRKEIDALRKSGITVVAISLKSEVLSQNDKIYGRGANVAAYSSTNVAKAIATIVINQLERN